MRIFVFIFWGTLALTLNGQIGIGTSSPVSSAQLDVTSTSSGVLFPRMTNAQMLAISSPATGLQVFNTNANSLYTYNGSQWLSALNSYKTYANAGVNVQFDNLIIQMTSSGNRSWFSELFPEVFQFLAHLPICISVLLLEHLVQPDLFLVIPDKVALCLLP